MSERALRKVSSPYTTMKTVCSSPCGTASTMASRRKPECERYLDWIADQSSSASAAPRPACVSASALGVSLAARIARVSGASWSDSIHVKIGTSWPKGSAQRKTASCPAGRRLPAYVAANMNAYESCATTSSAAATTKKAKWSSR